MSLLDGVAIKSNQFKVGDICRAMCTAPARYIGDGLCIYISAQDNSLHVNESAVALGGEEKLPLITDGEVEVAELVLNYMKRRATR